MARTETPQMDTLLIGYENQENLGLRSILAYLQSQGYRAKLIPFIPGNHEAVLAAVKTYQPRLVGFSLIFQYTLEEFGDLMQFLRVHGVTAHFTAGGHFPTLKPEETLALLPELDSVIRCEGEFTFPELLDHLDQPNQWMHIKGLAFRRGADIVLTSPRPLIADLDQLPLIHREKIPRQNDLGIAMASMLASRGCPFNCSFCSIRQFYGGSPGPLRRMRSPRAVVNEMNQLFTEQGVRLFMFQDDDFPIRTPHQQWLKDFLSGLEETGLAKQVRWKISCRVDDLEAKSLEVMKQHGLMAVYLGVESGNPVGLQTLNKHVTVAQNQNAIDLLKKYDLAMSMGFMLFDPSSTRQTIRENLAFLRQAGEDGHFPINFCKMLPYAGTPIENQLRESGRLKGTLIKPDYDFLDSALYSYEHLVQEIFTHRNFRAGGLVDQLQDLDFNNRLAISLGLRKLSDGYTQQLRQLISQSNCLAVSTLEQLLDLLGDYDKLNVQSQHDFLLAIAEQEWRGEAAIEIELAKLIHEEIPVEFSEKQDTQHTYREPILQG